MLHEALQIIHNNNVHEARRKRQASMSEKKAQSATQKMSQSSPQIRPIGFGSAITIHKLRESKWFRHNELKILLSVVETGFILEKRSLPDSKPHEWGIVIWEPGQEKSKNINFLNVYSMLMEKDKAKIIALQLDKFWVPETEIRINNQTDKEKPPNAEEDIRKQLDYALKNKSHKWHNSQHFPYFCRYEKSTPGRMQQISDRVKWTSIGVNLGMLMRGRNRKTTGS